MRIRKRHTPDSVEGEMTPMIDMTFQLIAFFMVLLNFSDVEQNQEINLPASELARPPEVPYEEPRTVQMMADGTILFGGDELTLEGLKSAMRTEAQLVRAYADKSLADVTVIIRADGRARTGDVQRVIEACQDAEFETFALRGRQSDVSTLIGP